MDIKKLKEILKIVEKTDFSEVEIVEKDWRLRVGRNSGQAVSIAYPSVSMPAPAAVAAPQAAPASGVAPVKAAEEPQGKIVTSPFVGTFYRAPGPDSPPFVDVGQKVQKGQTICIVEAMKLMNEIESDFDGKIAEIYVNNGQPVEFGEKLFRVE
ncbi:MAG: acetyl-CoA carboxylase biotin carboxyl carrier protein [Bdellovibrionota bacterium]